MTKVSSALGAGHPPLREVRAATEPDDEEGGG
jgi:hypothetical protein